MRESQNVAPVIVPTINPVQKLRPMRLQYKIKTPTKANGQKAVAGKAAESVKPATTASIRDIPKLSLFIYTTAE
jgi:hypothetical protein